MNEPPELNMPAPGGARVPAEASPTPEAAERSAAVFAALEELDQYERTGQSAIAEMNVIPFIDICLVLLIIVLVTTAFSVKLMVFDHPLATQVDEQGRPVLDERGSPRPAPTEYLDMQDQQGNLQVVKVEVSGKDQVLLNGQPVPMGQLGQAASALKGADGTCPAFMVVVGKLVESQYVIMVTDQLRQIGNATIVYTVHREMEAGK